MLGIASVVFFLAVCAVPVVAAPTNEEVVAVSTPAASEIPIPSPSEVATVEARQREEAEWLATPEAAAERAASQHAFAEVSASEASEVLVESFPEALASLNEDPGRVLTEAEVEKPLGAHAAVIDDGNGEKSLLETSVPVESELGGEGQQVVDLALERDGSGFSPINPIAELELPATAEGSISLHEGITVELPSDDDHEAVPLGEENLFIPETERSTDTLLSPIAGGVEISEQLRSSESPDEFIFRLGLPHGSTLQSNSAGGAEVLTGTGEVLEEVRPPSAVDAQGQNVPVEMRVAGESLIVEVADRSSSSYAYPILVDPWFTEETTNFAASGVWEKDEAGGFGLRNFGSSLNAYSQYNQWYAANTAAQWVYTAPGQTGYIEAATFKPIDYLPGSCSEEQPHGYIGLYNQDSQSYQSLYTYHSSNGANLTNWEFQTGWVGNPGVRNAMIGIGTANQAMNIGCYHELYVGGYSIQLGDGGQPILNAQGSDQWIDGIPIRLNVSASDSGLGVKRFRTEAIDTPGDPSWETVNSCVGTHASPCPAFWNLAEGSQPTLAFDPSVMREGIDQLKVTAYGPTDEPSTESGTVTVRVDHAPPTLTVSGTVTEQNTLGTERPNYTVVADAKDGVPGTQNLEQVRSGVKNVKMFEDGIEMESELEQAECAGHEDCEQETEYEFDTLEGSPGLHHLRVTSEDAMGHLSEWNGTFTITRDTTPPNLSVNGMPAEGAVVGAHPAEYSAKATDAGGGVTSLVFKVDGEVIEEVTQGCPHGGCPLDGSMAPNLSEVTPGEHVLTVVAIDGAGNQASVSRHVTVEPASPHIHLGGRLAERDGLSLGSEGGKLQIKAQAAEFAEGTGLVAAYSFDEGEGTVAHDATGNGHEGTVEGEAHWVSGKFGGALRFRYGQSHQCVAVPDSSDLSLGTEFTIEAWVKPEGSVEGSYPLIFKEAVTGAGLNYGLGIGMTQAGRVEGWAEWENIHSPEQLEEDAWTHLALTYDGNDLRLLVDGRTVSEGEFDMEELEGEGPLWIGCDGPQFGSAQFEGKIDEVRLYDRALGEGEIQEDEATPLSSPRPPSAPVAAFSFNEGAGTVAHDATGDGNEGAVEGAHWTSGKFGGALQFEGGGSQQCVTVPDSPSLQLSQEFTLEAWVKPESSGAYDPVIWKESEPGSVDSYALGIGLTQAGRVEGKNEWEDVYSPEPIEGEGWTHIAYTFDGQAQAIFVDGRQVYQKVIGSDELSSTGSMRIGCGGPSGGQFEGKIDEVRLYDRALDEGEIDADMGHEVSGSVSIEPTGPTISWLNVELDEEEAPGYPVECTGQCQTFEKEYEYDAATSGPGPHTLTIEAANSVGNTTSRTISIDAPESSGSTSACGSEVTEEPSIGPVTMREATAVVEEEIPAAVAPSEPGMNETGEEEVDPTYSEPDPNLVAEGTSAESETSVNPVGGISLAGVACITLGTTTPQATEAKIVNSDAAVFANTGAEADTVVRPTADGVMIDQSIRGPESNNFSLNVRVHEGDELVQLSSGSIAVVETPTHAQEEEGFGEHLVDEDEAPESFHDPKSLASAESQREDAEFEIALAAQQTSGTVVAVIPAPWVLLRNRLVIPAHIELAPVIWEPNEYIVHYTVQLPEGEAEAAVYPAQVLSNVSSFSNVPSGSNVQDVPKVGFSSFSPGYGGGSCSPCGEPDLDKASQYAVYWGNPNRVVYRFGTQAVYSRNPFYEDFGSNNCTNFISQIIRAGGETAMRFDHGGPEAWWYDRGPDNPWKPQESFFFEFATHSENWPEADELPRFLWQYGLVHIDPVQEPSGWTKGDILAYNWLVDGQGEFDHLNYVVGTTYQEGQRQPLIANSSEPRSANYGAAVWELVKSRINAEEPQGWSRLALAWKHTWADPGAKKHDPANLYGPNGYFQE
jgi:Concanavalin A-like lectin/glucanases superfamily/Putative amidase domain